MPAIPNVAKNGGNFSSTISIEFKTPTKTPVSNAAINATYQVMCSKYIRCPATAPVRPIVAPAERSSPPDTSTSVIANAPIEMPADDCRMLTQLSQDINIFFPDRFVGDFSVKKAADASKNIKLPSKGYFDNKFLTFFISPGFLN